MSTVSMSPALASAPADTTAVDRAAFIELTRTLIQVIRDAGPLGVPAGTLYLPFMSDLSAQQFDNWLAAIVRTGLITRDPSGLCRYVGPEKPAAQEQPSAVSPDPVATVPPPDVRAIRCRVARAVATHCNGRLYQIEDHYYGPANLKARREVIAITCGGSMPPARHAGIGRTLSHLFTLFDVPPDVCKARRLEILADRVKEFLAA